MDEIEVGRQVTFGETIIRRKTADTFSLTHRLSRDGVSLTRDEVRALAEGAGFEVIDPDG